MRYKFMNGSGKVFRTDDKIFADFMSKRLSFWERIVLLFA